MEPQPRRLAPDHVRPSTAATTSPRRSLDHLEGYRGSSPGAHRQRRVRPAPARHLRRADGLGLPLQQVRRADLARPLDEPRRGSSTGCAGTGSTPTRGSGRCAAAAQEFLYSRLMCWVAVDRGIRLGDQRSLPVPVRTRGGESRDAIYNDILTNFWDADRGHLRAAQGRDDGRRVDPADAAGEVHPPDRSALALGTLRAIDRGPRRRLARLSLPDRERGERRTHRRGRHLQHVLVLVRRGASPVGRRAAGAVLLREDARLRQPPRPLRRGARPARRAPRATSRRPSPTSASSARPTRSTASSPTQAGSVRAGLHRARLALPASPFTHACQRKRESGSVARTANRG